MGVKMFITSISAGKKISFWLQNCCRTYLRPAFFYPTPSPQTNPPGCVSLYPFCIFPCPLRHAADPAAATVVDLLPSLTTNSSPTTLNSSTTPGLEPNAAQSSATPPVSTPADTPLVDLTDGPSIEASQPSATQNSVPSRNAPAAKNTTGGVSVDAGALKPDTDGVKDTVHFNGTCTPVGQDEYGFSLIFICSSLP